MTTTAVGFLGLLLSTFSWTAQPPAAEGASGVVESLRAEAAALRPLVVSSLAKGFLDSTKSLPEPGKRTVYRTADGLKALSAAEFEGLPESEREKYKARECSAEFYYTTGYGSPLIYCRAIDLLATRAPAFGGEQGAKGKRIVDFGYGSIGHLRMLASLGAEVTGIEVQPLFRALYSEAGDTGAIAGVAGGAAGRLRLLEGRWPAEEAIVKEVAGGGGGGGAFDLFISKNTLKRGYIHPAREVDPKFLVKLGVSDEAYLKSVFEVLAPGGWFMIYNISPGQNTVESGKPYLPHADGQCPFTREQLAGAGFEVVVFDEPDQEAVLKIWSALKIDESKPREELAKDLYAWWTLARRPEGAKPAAGATSLEGEKR